MKHSLLFTIFTLLFLNAAGIFAKEEDRSQQPRFATQNSGLAVFGEQLFQGNFSKSSFNGFNPNHIIGIGDHISVRLWGAFEYAEQQVVDPQGNIFIPNVGPIMVAGIKNANLQDIVQTQIQQVYRSNVHSYTNLADAQPVKIFVSGFAVMPGMYEGLSSDSILNFIDQAGGVDPNRGSYVDILVKRGGSTIAEINLYNFILKGKINSPQLYDGDIIHIQKARNQVSVSGLVNNSYQFQFSGHFINFNELAQLANPSPKATNIRIIRNTGNLRNVEYYAIDEIPHSMILSPGDEVIYNADKRPGTISVRVEGEHASNQEYVLPHGSSLSMLLEQVQFTKLSNENGISLFRQSIKEKQKALLDKSLRSLESSVLTARSATSEEATLRQQEAKLVMQWIEKARAIKPEGRVILPDPSGYQDLTLENGDVLTVAGNTNLVTIQGEVIYPTTVSYDTNFQLKDYLDAAGGYSQNAKTAKVLIQSANGKIEVAKRGFMQKVHSADIAPGDEILVLPKVELKRLQISKDITQVMYQLALSAAVVLSL